MLTKKDCRADWKTKTSLSGKQAGKQIGRQANKQIGRLTFMYTYKACFGHILKLQLNLQHH